jgi:glutathione S-transferase
VLAIMALKDHIEIGCEVQAIDLSKGDQCAPKYASLHPNRKMPMLEDDGFVLWESIAILFYWANKRPQSGLWPRETKGQADVLRWLAWESVHWDAESVGTVAFEKTSKRAYSALDRQTPLSSRVGTEFARSAAVLDESLRERSWLAGGALTIADLSTLYVNRRLSYGAKKLALARSVVICHRQMTAPNFLARSARGFGVTRASCYAPGVPEPARRCLTD